MTLTALAAGFKRHVACKAMPVCFSTLCSLVVLVSSTSVQAKDACESVLCLYGKLTGNSGGGDCRQAEQDYFAIQVKKHGKIRWDATAAQRGQYLNSCSSADRSFTKKINDKFGKALR